MYPSRGNVEFHLGTGLPGDATSVVLLYLALNWLILERLTLPEVIPGERVDELVAEAVRRIVPG
ncbi:ABC-F family ATP-binding cassette domain-containing protein [Microbispora sp. ATCC PTA-5024]|uniref:ABC-F family ATP-binding cassette domain-containing protein n=1 Tax=Microbispora sp. ATCC PTA-5024 TaxID=316330 RepID=UPI0003DBAF67|nr:ABC-F family ATP-binding cassette domain-containing protein [Microbispora sp. ATCC PTA-5024]ETK37868.1 hypothetical protein MPTA5024_01825 [Microbispora sp. ATCC PTA-5024]